MSTRTVGSCGQLTTGSKTIGHKTLEENGLEIGPGQIDGSGMPRRTRADDDLGRKEWAYKLDGGPDGEILRLWSASLCSSRSFQ